MLPVCIWLPVLLVFLMLLVLLVRTLHLEDMAEESVALVFGHNSLPDELVHDVGKVSQEKS